MYCRVADWACASSVTLGATAAAAVAARKSRRSNEHLVEGRQGVRAIRFGQASGLLISTGKEKDIAVGIAHDERAGTPRLASERLNKLDAGILIFGEERLCIRERDRRG